MAVSKIGRNATDTGIADSSDATAITIDSSERVGIANTSPLLKLDVTGSNTAPPSSGTSQSGSLRLGQTAGNGVMDMGFDTVNTQGWIQATNKANLATNYKLTLNPNGGAVTMPSQPAFSAYPDQNQNNFAINATTTVVFDAELFDQGGDFNTSNYTFTAPVTGRYMLFAQIRFDNLDLENAYYVLYIDTSNRNYYNIIAMHGGGTHLYNADPDYFSIQMTAFADMDANDTATVKINIPNAGAAQADVIGTGDGNPQTRFSGYLVA